MRTKALLALLLLGSVSAVAQPRPITFEDLLAIKRVGAPQISPDGKWIAYDQSAIDTRTNVRQSAIHVIATSGGEARQITDGAKQDEGPVWSPDGKSLAYVSNRDTPAKQVWVVDTATGKSRRISNLPGGAGSVKWTPDSSAVIVVSDIYPECGVEPACIKDKETAEGNAPTQARVIDSLLYRHWRSWTPSTRSHIVLQPVGEGAPRDLTPGPFDAPPFSVGGGDEFDVSPDGRELVFARNTDERPETSTNSDLFIVPISGGDAKRITTRTGADTSPKYSPDGKWIAWRSQSRAGFESDLWELWLYERATGRASRLASDFPEWIESITWLPDSTALLITAPERGRNAIFEVPLRGPVTKLFATGSADALTVSRDGQTLAFTWSTLRRPAEIYTMKRRGGPTQLTHANDALFAGLAVGEVRDLTWTGAAGKQIQGHLVTPPDFDRTRRYPAIVLIHGGPQGAWVDSWGYRWNPQIFASKGYVVLLPNPRGSVGFGQKFVEEISRDWGGKVYTDIMNGVDALVALPYVDGSRLGAAGGSYGGYMVNWILGHNNRFKALVSHAGVYNLISMYGVTEELWFPEWEFGGTPWDNPEDYLKWSPNMFVKNFRTPTLVTHGELDFRVPINQGLELFTALQRRGVPSKLLYYPDEGHWVLKPQNSRLWYATVGGWFDQWLKAR